MAKVADLRSGNRCRFPIELFRGGIAEMASTKTSRCRFTVKESAQGEPWILLEQESELHPAIDQGLLGLHLEPGSTLEDAHELARRLEAQVAFASFTDL